MLVVLALLVLDVDDDELAANMRAIRNHGGAKRGHHTLVGLNGRFDTLQAAVLLAKLPYFENEIKSRTCIGARYSEFLSDYCITPAISAGNSHVYAQYTIRLANRDDAKLRLHESGIPTAIYYSKCLHEQPVFKTLGYDWGDFPVSEKVSREVLSLPMHPFLTEKDQDQIIYAIKNINNI